MQDYIKQAIRTESTINDPVIRRLEHAAIGICTEGGELLDALKKVIFYGKELDTTNMKEEVGDILWYLAILCDALGTDFDTEMQRNIAKLKARYPQKFTSENALNRDLEKERKVLESAA